MGRVKKFELIDENIESNDITLDQLREKLLDYQAFNNENTLFQKLAKDNGFKFLVNFDLLRKYAIKRKKSFLKLKNNASQLLNRNWERIDTTKLKKILTICDKNMNVN
ncbi:hypothetical protein BpHYR1_035447 [Brachionus plicatilis]|uniref:Uncharacterized protein n=1 Tax=Brachionus plicatilis TaxID=10195 RepID=A0A3M7SRX8_BRAPC|nr:hypothetical protein BpHYR1_035447 [Brachionus plicatilis]